MPSQVNIWDVDAALKKKLAREPIDCGFPRDIDKHYDLGDVLGKGGFATVVGAVHRDTGVSYACKVIEKNLDLPGVSVQKQQFHIQNINREVEVLSMLTGCPSVVHFESVYEDDRNVYIVMEACTGGELWHDMGSRHTSERTVCSSAYQNMFPCNYGLAESPVKREHDLSGCKRYHPSHYSILRNFGFTV